VLWGLHAAWARRNERATLFLLSWLLPSWAVFEAVPTKLPHYTMPLYPALMLLAAASLATPPRWFRLGAGMVAALAGLTLGLGAAALPILLHAPWWLGAPALLCALTLAVWATRPTVTVRAGVATALLYAAILGFELPRLDALWIAPRIQAVLRAASADDPQSGAGLIAAGYAEPSLMFLVGTRITLLPNGRGAADNRAGAVIVTDTDQQAYLKEAARRHRAPKQMAHIDGFNYSRGAWTGLGIFTQ
jgi:4-amino-4-deoxy-L-arabinose transferase-like glycosyltransferase